MPRFRNIIGSKLLYNIQDQEGKTLGYFDIKVNSHTQHPQIPSYLYIHFFPSIETIRILPGSRDVPNTVSHILNIIYPPIKEILEEFLEDRVTIEEIWDLYFCLFHRREYLEKGRK